MKSKNNNTEELILEAAEELFLDKGFEGTSTTEIAKKVGCNQALIHYYFRTKENLFAKIFEKKTNAAMSFIAKNLPDKTDFLEKIKHMINQYFNFLIMNEKMPYFFINELLRNDKCISLVIDLFETNITRLETFHKFDQLVQEEVRKGVIRKIDTFNLLFDIFSLCIATFISIPIFQRVNGENPNFKSEYIESRRQEIINVIIQGLQPSKSK
jgi:AcrR family transcriptional regulator